MKVAILGAWHVHAKDYLKAARTHGEVVGVWEKDAKRLADFAAANELYAFSSLEELLESDAEAVIVCAATCDHTEYIIRAAEHKKHIFTEKILAFTEEECLRIRDAIQKAGVRFVISFPWMSRAGMRTLKQAVDEGMIGKVNYVRFRNCHDGSTRHWLPAHFYNQEECGGGAMIDLGAHGMYLIRWILGEPAHYASSFTHYCNDEQDMELNPQGLEDNAVTVMTYPDGAIAINETGFVNAGCPQLFEIGGEKGHLVFNGRVATCFRAGKQIDNLELVSGAPLPIECFLKGEPIPLCAIEDAISMTRMMQGAYGNIH